MAFPDPHYYYRLLVPGVVGPGYAADVHDVGPCDSQAFMAPIGGRTGQLWRFAPTGDGAWRLSTLFRGPAFSAEAVEDGPEGKVRLRPGASDAQAWIVEPIDGPFALAETALGPFARSAYARLSTRLRGPAWSLDLTLGGGGFLPSLTEGRDRPGQAWFLSCTEARAH